MPPTIKRGEIYWVDWSPGRGSEQIGVRPALIIQNDIGNLNSPTTIVAACSTAPVDSSYPFIVQLSPQESGLKKACHVNLAQIQTIDKSHLQNKCGELNRNNIVEVNNAIKASLGMW
jgi:mRNA interferase MazF